MSTRCCNADGRFIVTGVEHQSPFTSLRGTVAARGALVVLGCALAGYQSTVFGAYRRCQDYRDRFPQSGGGGSAANCQLPLASGILAWITVAAVRAEHRSLADSRSHSLSLTRSRPSPSATATPGQPGAQASPSSQRRRAAPPRTSAPSTPRRSKSRRRSCPSSRKHYIDYRRLTIL